MQLRCLLFPLLLLCILVGCSSGQSGSDTASFVTDHGTDIPGGIVPAVRIGGTDYTYTGLAFPLHGADVQGGEVYVNAAGSTKLPDGYTEVGDISSVTQDALSEERQLRAGYDATGTIYTSSATPEVVYVLIRSDVFDAFDEAYFRFVSDARGKDSIYYQGNRYLADFGGTFPGQGAARRLPANRDPSFHWNRRNSCAGSGNQLSRRFLQPSAGGSVGLF